MTYPTINELIEPLALPEPEKRQLIAQLIAREEAICDVLRLAGAQFGLFPQIVAEVLAEVGMGEPISAEQREMVRANFSTLMEHLREEHGVGPDDPTSDV